MDDVDAAMQNIYCQVTERVSWVEYESYPSEVFYRLDDRVRMQMAAFIAKEKVITTDAVVAKKQGFFDKRLDLYVASPDVFWRIVNKKAESISMQYSRTLLNPKYSLPKVTDKHVDTFSIAFNAATQANNGASPVQAGLEAVFALLRKEL